MSGDANKQVQLPPPPAVDDDLVRRLMDENERLKRQLQLSGLQVTPPPPLAPPPSSNRKKSGERHSKAASKIIAARLSMVDTSSMSRQHVEELIENMFTFDQLTDLDAEMLDTVGAANTVAAAAAAVAANGNDDGSYDGSSEEPSPITAAAAETAVFSHHSSGRHKHKSMAVMRDKLAIEVSDALNSADDAEAALKSTLDKRSGTTLQPQAVVATVAPGSVAGASQKSSSRLSTGSTVSYDDDDDDDNDDDDESPLEGNDGREHADDDDDDERPVQRIAMSPGSASVSAGLLSPKGSKSPKLRPSSDNPSATLRDRVKSINIELLGLDDDKPDAESTATKQQAIVTVEEAALSLEERVINDMRDALEDEINSRPSSESLANAASPRPLSVQLTESTRGSVDLLKNKSVPSWLVYTWCTMQPRPGVLRSIHPLVEVLSMEEYAITKALGKVTPLQDMDEVVRQVMRAFEGSGLALELLDRMIKQEVNDTKEPSTLFRLNSIASKLLSVYARMVGKSFLQRVLWPVMRDIKALGRLEIDPIRNENELSVANNLSKLTQACTQVLETLFSTVSSCPLSLRMLSCTIKQHVELKFPGFGNVGISGFLFLRFICAAIAAPEAFGFQKEPLTSDERRSYVLVSKILQNLANGVKFGHKESYMLAFNSFLEVYEPKLFAYFDVVSAPVQVNPASLPMVTPRSMVEEATMRLGAYIETILDKLLVEVPNVTAQEITHSLLDQLKAVLREFPQEISGQDLSLIANDFALMSRFEEVLIAKHALLFKLLLANVVSSKDLDWVCKTAVHVLSPRNRTVDFVGDVLADELKSFETINKFCESQSLSFRLIAGYISTIAYPYLKRTLVEVVADVCATGHLFESTHLGSKNVVRNMDALLNASFKFFGCIVNSLFHCPLPLRQLCTRIFGVVSAHFKSHQAGLVVLSQILFLRFFCPAIASPQAFQLVDTAPSEKAHRALVVISYSLKHLAAGTYFKDPQLVELNTFLRDHSDLLQEFIAKIATIPVNGPIEAEVIQAVPFDVRVRALLGVRVLFSKDVLDKLKTGVEHTQRTQTVRYKVVDRLAIVLADRYPRIVL